LIKNSVWDQNQPTKTTCGGWVHMTQAISNTHRKSLSFRPVVTNVLVKLYFFLSEGAINHLSDHHIFG
jgi:hypothetical protein